MRAEPRRRPSKLTFASCQSLRRLAIGILSASCIAAPASANLQASELGRYYASVQSALLAKGFLRQDRAVPGMPTTASTLERDFAEIAMTHEYGSGSRGTRLLRWEEPVRMQIAFGASVSDSQRQNDQQMIGRYAERLKRVTGHPIRMDGAHPNFHVLVVSDGERRSLAAYLKVNVDGISGSAINAILRMPPSRFCMVVGVPHADRRKGYRSAVAIVRAEHGNMMRQSCLQEELAQGMGLPNDCDRARPSIFNDNGEFAVLTRHDELLLKMLYDPALKSGMTMSEANPVVHRLARSLAN